MRQRGFTLPEVLVALVILTIIIMTSLAVFVERNRRLQQASETILAYQALANEAEYWRREPYQRLDSTEEFRSELTLLGPLGEYTTAVTVEDSEDTPGVKYVTLTIAWMKGKREASLEVIRVDTGGSALW